eukprot:233318-Amphidinium_carterae.1
MEGDGGCLPSGASCDAVRLPIVAQWARVQSHYVRASSRGVLPAALAQALQLSSPLLLALKLCSVSAAASKWRSKDANIKYYSNGNAMCNAILLFSCLHSIHTTDQDEHN